MKIKRFIGKTDKLPNYYIELFLNQQKNVISKVVYNKTTFELTPISEVEQTVLDKMEKKEFKSIQGEEFKSFVKGKASYLKSFDYLREEDDDFRFLHYDVLYNGCPNVTLYSKEHKANIVFMLKDGANQFASFTNEELKYPINLYFLCKSTSEVNKVNFFMNEGDGRTGLLAVYKTPELFYVAEIDCKLHEIINMEIYDVNCFANVSDIANDEDTIKVKEEIETIAWARNSVMIAKEYESYFK